MSSISSFFSSFISTTYADSDKAPETEAVEEVVEEEAEEPEDVAPQVREDCKESRCAALAKHFDHCQEKVQEGKGFKGEDCVEELVMHCIDDCAASKLFTKLR